MDTEALERKVAAAMAQATSPTPSLPRVPTASTPLVSPPLSASGTPTAKAAPSSARAALNGAAGTAGGLSRGASAADVLSSPAGGAPPPSASEKRKVLTGKTSNQRAADGTAAPSTPVATPDSALHAESTLSVGASAVEPPAAAVRTPTAVGATSSASVPAPTAAQAPPQPTSARVTVNRGTTERPLTSNASFSRRPSVGGMSTSSATSGARGASITRNPAVPATPTSRPTSATRRPSATSTSSGVPARGRLGAPVATAPGTSRAPPAAGSSQGGVRASSSLLASRSGMSTGSATPAARRASISSASSQRSTGLAPQPVTRTTSGVSARSTSSTSRLATNSRVAPPLQLSSTRSTAQRSTTPGSTARSAAYDHVRSRFRQAAADAPAQQARLAGVPANRAGSVPPPPPSAYSQQTHTHTREWIDVTNRTSMALAAEVDALAVAASLGLTLSDSGAAPALNEEQVARVARSMDPALLTAALDLTTPVPLPSSTARRSISRGATGRNNAPLFGKGRADLHPMRRSAVTAEMEDEVERARAAALGLLVGAKPLSSEQTSSVVDRLYSRAAEKRERDAERSALLADAECTFQPAITALGARSTASNRLSYAVVDTDSAASRHDLLYANAQALAAKRANAVAAEANADLNCTFQPEITRRARVLAEAARGRQIEDLKALSGEESVEELEEALRDTSTRMHALARVAAARKSLLAEDVQAMSVTGRPSLNPRSLAIASRSASVDRPALHERKVRPDMVERLKEERELVGCTFRPSINQTPLRSRSSSVEPVHDRLLDFGRRTMQRKEVASQDRDMRATASCTFAPVVDARSSRIVASKGRPSITRSRSVDTSGGGGGSGRTLGSTKLAATPVAPPTVLTDRLHAEAAEIRARLEEKRAQLEAAARSQAPFRPKIDPNSRIMSMNSQRFNTVTAEGGDSFRRTSVYERLYADAQDFENMRASAITQALESELSGFTFRPSIDDRSRALAAASERALMAMATMAQADAAAAGSSPSRVAVWDRLYAISISEAEVRALHEELSRRIEMRDCTFQPRTLHREALQRALAATAASTAGASGEPAGVGGAASANTASAEAAPVHASRDVWSELASQHRDYEKLEETKARLELAMCSFQPNQPAPAETVRSVLEAHRSSPVLTGMSQMSEAGSATGRSPSASVVRPAEIWDRVVAEVQEEAASGQLQHVDAALTSRRSGSPSRSSSPVHERLYEEGVKKMSVEQERLAKLAEARELEGCTFQPQIDSSAPANVSGGTIEVHERLYTDAMLREQVKSQSSHSLLHARSQASMSASSQGRKSPRRELEHADSSSDVMGVWPEEGLTEPPIAIQSVAIVSDDGFDEFEDAPVVAPVPAPASALPVVVPVRTADVEPVALLAERVPAPAAVVEARALAAPAPAPTPTPALPATEAIELATRAPSPTQLPPASSSAEQEVASATLPSTDDATAVPPAPVVADTPQAHTSPAPSPVVQLDSAPLVAPLAASPKADAGTTQRPFAPRLPSALQAVKESAPALPASPLVTDRSISPLDAPTSSQPAATVVAAEPEPALAPVDLDDAPTVSSVASESFPSTGAGASTGAGETPAPPAPATEQLSADEIGAGVAVAVNAETEVAPDIVHPRSPSDRAVPAPALVTREDEKPAPELALEPTPASAPTTVAPEEAEAEVTNAPAADVVAPRSPSVSKEYMAGGLNITTAEEAEAAGFV